MWMCLTSAPCVFPCSSPGAASRFPGGDSSCSLWQTGSNSRPGAHCRPGASGVLAAGRSLQRLRVIRLLKRLYVTSRAWEHKSYIFKAISSQNKDIWHLLNCNFISLQTSNSTIALVSREQHQEPHFRLKQLIFQKSRMRNQSCYSIEKNWV